MSALLRSAQCQNNPEEKPSVLERASGMLLRSGTFKSRPVNYAIHGLYALAAENFDIQAPELSALFKIIRHPHKYYTVLKGFAKSIHAIDDRLDVMEPMDILNAGEAKIGITPSEFLLNNQIFSSVEYTHAQELYDLGFISAEEGIAFANLASVIVKEETQHILDYQQNHYVADRKAMLESDRKITETLVAFIVHWFNRNPAIKDIIEENNGLTHEDILLAYPNVTKLFRAMEMKDDFLDFVPDLKQEMDSGRPVANWFLTWLHENGKLLDNDGNIQPYLIEFLEKNEKRTKKIPLSDLPEPLLMAVQKATHDYKEVANQFPKMKSILRADWDNNLSDGCYSVIALEKHNNNQL